MGFGTWHPGDHERAKQARYRDAKRNRDNMADGARVVGFFLGLALVLYLISPGL